MTFKEALRILEIDDDVDEKMLKEQFRWFVLFYHPDNPRTGDREEFDRAVKAYEIVKKGLFGT